MKKAFFSITVLLSLSASGYAGTAMECRSKNSNTIVRFEDKFENEAKVGYYVSFGFPSRTQFLTIATLECESTVTMTFPGVHTTNCGNALSSSEELEQYGVHISRRGEEQFAGSLIEIGKQHGFSARTAIRCKDVN